MSSSPVVSPREIAELHWLALHLPPAPDPKPTVRASEELVDSHQDEDMKPMSGVLERLLLDTTPGSGPRTEPGSDPPPSGIELVEVADRSALRCKALARDRALAGFGRVAGVGRREVDLRATIRMSAELGTLFLVTRAAEERVTELILVVDRASTMEPWADEIRGLIGTLERVSQFARVHHREVDLRSALPRYFLRATDRCVALPAVGTSADPCLVMIVSDGLAPAFAGLGASIGAHVEGLLVWIHPWGAPRWVRTPAGACRRSVPRETHRGGPVTAALVGFDPAELATLRRFLREGDTRGLWGVYLPNSAAPVLPPSPHCEHLARLSAVAAPAVLRLVALAAATGARFDLELLQALGARLGGGDAPIDIAEALASGLLRRVGSDRPAIFEMTPDARDAALEWLPRRHVKSVWIHVRDRLRGVPWPNKYGIDVDVLAMFLGEKLSSPALDPGYAKNMRRIALLVGLSVPAAVEAAVSLTESDATIGPFGTDGPYDAEPSPVRESARAIEQAAPDSAEPHSNHPAPWRADEDDERLLLGWAAGDGNSGAKLLRRQFAVLNRFFRNKIHNESDIPDLIQETMLSCVRSGVRERGLRGTFRAYLFGIARHVLLDYLYRSRLRDRAHDRTVDMDIEFESIDSLGDSSGISSVLMQRSEQQTLFMALRTLPINQQVILELRYWEELTGPECAQVLGVPEGTVRSRLRVALDALKSALASQIPSTKTRSLSDWKQDIQEYRHQASRGPGGRDNRPPEE